jgi:glycosyltransferase involved in cell wall biosynthesis
MNGRGRMWHEVLTRLAPSCDLRSVPDEALGGGRRARLSQWSQRSPDVWLFDGHNGPLPVRQPQVIQLHEAPWTEPETMATLDPHFIEVVVEPSRRAARAAAAVVCPSESSKRQIVEDSGVAPERVFVAHHGVDHAIFRPGLSGGAAVAAAHGADPDLPYLLTVASLHPRKNLLALREAFVQLVGEGFPHQLLIVGGPAYGRFDGDDLVAAVSAEVPGAPGRLVLVPFGLSDEDVAALMGGATAFCLPSLSEGFGLPAMEAMACGVPAVLSDRAALRELGQDAAVLVEPTADGIAEGLRSLLVDPVRAGEVGSAGIARARDFTWDRCAAAWLRAIEAGAAVRPLAV